MEYLAGEEIIAKEIHKICNRIWQEQRLPEEFKQSIIMNTIIVFIREKKI